MPCYDSRNAPEYVRAEALAEFTHNSPVAEMLCSVMREIEAGAAPTISPQLAQWWVAHKRRDSAKSA